MCKVEQWEVILADGHRRTVPYKTPSKVVEAIPLDLAKQASP